WRVGQANRKSECQPCGGSRERLQSHSDHHSVSSRDWFQRQADWLWWRVANQRKAACPGKAPAAIAVGDASSEDPSVKMMPDNVLSFATGTDHLSLPRRTEIGRRWHGCGVQGRGHPTGAIRCPEVPSCRCRWK